MGHIFQQELDAFSLSWKRDLAGDHLILLQRFFRR